MMRFDLGQVAGLVASKIKAYQNSFLDEEASESRILSNHRMSITEKIDEIIEKQEDNDGIEFHRDLLDSERRFLLRYASQDINQTKISQEDVDEFSGNIIRIINFFFDYGFAPTRSQNTSMDTLSNSSSSACAPHFWDVITKHFSSEYQNICYVNDEYEDGSPEVTK